jgi:Domain of unknown function (DUF4333)
MRVRFARVVALAAVAASAAACTKTLDKRGLEAQLATQLPGLTVHCPDGVKAQAGAVFTCAASDPSGSGFQITVTQTDDKGNVTWTVTGASGVPSVSSSPTASAST